MAARFDNAGPPAHEHHATKPDATVSAGPQGNLETSRLVTHVQLAGLQVHAGNRAVAGLFAQRLGDDSGENAVDRALRTKDPGDVKAIDKNEIAGLPIDKKMALIRILAYQGWVGPFDETKIEEIWGTLTTKELVGTGSQEIVMFNHCVTVGAELDQLANVKLMSGDFISDTRSIALGYLKLNGELITSEMAGLGIPAAAGEAAVPPTEAQAQKLADTQRAAASVADLQRQMEAARKVPVGYGPASSVPMLGDSAGGPGDGEGPVSQDWGGSAGGFDGTKPVKYADVALFEPGKPPAFRDPAQATAAGYTLLNPAGETKVFESLDTLFARASATVSALLGHYPALMALSKTGKSEDAGALAAENDPAAARVRLGAAMRAVLENIAKAQSGLDVGGGGIDPLDLQPIHRQMFQGQAAATGQGNAAYDWTQSLPKLVAEQRIGDHEFGKVLSHMGLSTLSAAAFLVAPFTGGASLAMLLAVGVGAAAANAANSVMEYDKLLGLSKSTVKPGTELVDQGQVDAAKAQKDADETELAMAVFTAATLGLGQVGKYKALATAVQDVADAVELAQTVQELMDMFNQDGVMYQSMFEIDIPEPAANELPVQRQLQGTRPVWEDFEIHAAGQLQSGQVPGIPQMDIVLPGIHNASGNGIDRIGLRRTKSGKIEVWHFEIKWNYLETENPDPKLWERGGKIQFDKDWEVKAIDRLCDSNHPSALAAQDAVRQYLATHSGRPVHKVPLSEVIDTLRTRARGRAVLIREGFVPATLLEQLARMLKRRRRVRLGRVIIP